MAKCNHDCTPECPGKKKKGGSPQASSEQQIRMDHEVLDRAYLVAEMFDEKVANHPHLTKKQKKRAGTIAKKLWAFYSDVFDGGPK